MNKLIKAFSLIELIVWISISMLLMVSVWIFISNWMQNILSQTKVLENTDNFTDFSNELHSSFNLIQTWSFTPELTSSWILFKRQASFWEWWFTYIWTGILNEVYCESGTGVYNTGTLSMYIKNFIPFEENLEDIFLAWWYEEILTWSTTIPSTYTSFQKEHIIKDWTTPIIWKWIFWDKFIEWAQWTSIYLNSPTWLALSWNILFISDTLNNRILYYKIAENEIYTLLNESDWLNEPTWLYYHEWDKALYISNSWNWEILKYSSKYEWTNPSLNITFNNISASFIDKLTIKFFSWSLSQINITWPTNTWSFLFTNITPNTDLTTVSTNELNYYFSNYLSIDTDSWTIPIPFCLDNTNSFLEVDDKPRKEVTTCSDTHTWTVIKYEWFNFKDFNPISTYNITINNITPTFTNTWNYYVNLKLINTSWVEQYSWYFPYFTQWDDDITTIWDNTLEVYASWLTYPTWIRSWWSIIYNQFSDLWYNNLDYHSTDTLLWTPIESSKITVNNDLISVLLKYYRRYNCYNTEDNSKKTFILKKNLK